MPPAPEPAPAVGEQAPLRSVRPAAAANPYAGERKIQVNPRVFPTLWGTYEGLVAGVRESNGRANLTDLVNAVLHYHRPAGPAEARELLTRFRTMLAQDAEQTARP